MAKIRLKAALAQAKADLPDILRSSQNGIVLLTLIPFMISGSIFAPFASRTHESLAALPQVYLPWIAVFLVLLSAACAVVTRNSATVVATISAVFLLALALQGQRPLEAFGLAGVHPALTPSSDALYEPYTFLGDTAASTIIAFYTLTGLGSLITMVVRPTVSRPLFRVVLIVMLLDVLLFSFLDGRTLFGLVFVAYFPSQISVLISLLVLMMLRMVVKFTQENRATYRAAKQADPRLLRSVTRTTLRLWWPMLVIFVVFLALYGALNETYVRQPLIKGLNTLESDEEGVRVYEDGKALPAAEFPGGAPDTVEEAAKAAYERLSAAQTAAITARIKKQAKEFDGDTDVVLSATRDAMPKRFPGTKTRRCRFLDVGCYIKNGIKSMINSAYVSARESMLDDLARDLERADGGVENNAQAAIAEVERRAKVMEEQAKRRIGNTATGLHYFSWASLLLSVVVLIKSLMIVFARVFYARVPFKATNLAETAEEGTPRRARIGRMVGCGSQAELTPEAGQMRYYVAFRACGNNVVDRRRIPQPARLSLKRLFSRNLMMCLIDFEADRKITSCDLIVDPPAEILQWDLLEGDEVFVDVTTVIGFSESCKLGRTISLSLGSLIFGRAIYHSVKGPGRLFLRTESKPLAGAEKGTQNIMQSSSLIAWRRDAHFNIVSSLTVGDTFLSGFSVRKADQRGHVVVYDTSQQRRVGTGGGILKMARSFLIPF